MSSREDFPGSDEWYSSRGLTKPKKKDEPITAHTPADVKNIMQRVSGLVIELSTDLNMTERTIWNIIKTTNV